MCVYVDFSGQAWVLQALCYSKFLRFHRCFRPGLLLQTLFLIIAWPLLGLFDRCFRLGLVSTNPKAPRVCVCGCSRPGLSSTNLKAPSEPSAARRVRHDQAYVLQTLCYNKFLRFYRCFRPGLLLKYPMLYHCLTCAWLA